MMNADEIVKALRDYMSDCDNDDACYQCTFKWVCDKLDGNAAKIIADLIEKQQARIAELEQQLAEERDASKELADGTADLIDNNDRIREQLAESQKREQEEKDKIGNWPVCVGSKFCGALIVGADSRNSIVEISWKRGPQEAGKGTEE